MRVRHTHATWTRISADTKSLDYHVEAPLDRDLPGDSLWDAICEQERTNQTTTYASTLEAHANDEVWVHWEDEADVGSDRYQPLTDRGVRIGGCRNHRPDQCWWIGDPFPPGAQAHHIVIGPLARLAPHRNCEWAATLGAMGNELHLRTTNGSVGENRCCTKPYALTHAEQIQITLVAADIADVMGLHNTWVRNYDLLLGWRLFGVHDHETRWPDFPPNRDVHPELVDCWTTQLALQELD